MKHGNTLQKAFIEYLPNNLAIVNTDNVVMVSMVR